jgi:Na+-transporting NADH:ubiquinone oxidoreductase subunit NqrE
MFKKCTGVLVILFALTLKLFAQNKTITLAISKKFAPEFSIDITAASIVFTVSARVRELIHNTLVKKNEKLEYVLL